MLIRGHCLGGQTANDLREVFDADSHVMKQMSAAARHTPPQSNQQPECLGMYGQRSETKDKQHYELLIGAAQSHWRWKISNDVRDYPEMRLSQPKHCHRSFPGSADCRHA